MFEAVIEWLGSQWLELASVLLACVALFYAHLAYRSSVQNFAESREVQLTELRVQANEALANAVHSFMDLESKCRQSRVAWEQFEMLELPPLAPRVSAFRRFPSDRTRHKGSSLLQDLQNRPGLIESMSAKELEAALHAARVASLKIMALAAEIEPPSMQAYSTYAQATRL